MEPTVRFIYAPRRLISRRGVRKWMAAADIPASLRGQIVVLIEIDLVRSWAAAADEIVKQLVVERDADALLVSSDDRTFRWQIIDAAIDREVRVRVDYAVIPLELQHKLYARGVSPEGILNAVG